MLELELEIAYMVIKNKSAVPALFYVQLACFILCLMKRWVSAAKDEEGGARYDQNAQSAKRREPRTMPRPPPTPPRSTHLTLNDDHLGNIRPRGEGGAWP